LRGRKAEKQKSGKEEKKKRRKGGKKLRITLGEGNSGKISPDAGSSDISSDMKHRTVDG
jgi:hypothetical protein